MDMRSVRLVSSLLLVATAACSGQQRSTPMTDMRTLPSIATAYIGGPEPSELGIITEYPLPAGSGKPDAITLGPDGALWFTADGVVGQIGRITTSGAPITIYQVNPGGSSISYPSMVGGPDGALWFTDSQGSAVGRITTFGSVLEYPTPSHSSIPYGITAGPDGALWFTESAANTVGRITTAGAITEYRIPAPGVYPLGITAGPDGALWFVMGCSSGPQAIGRVTTSGQFTEYQLPANAIACRSSIVTGPDGALWFTEFGASKIGRITTSGQISAFNLAPNGQPQGITAGKVGAVWFTEAAAQANAIGRITIGGPVATYSIPTRFSDPVGITSGPDQALWFTEAGRRKIGRIAAK
jgi:virginiamycin B lyase